MRILGGFHAPGFLLGSDCHGSPKRNFGPVQQGFMLPPSPQSKEDWPERSRQLGYVFGAGETGRQEPGHRRGTIRAGQTVARGVESRHISKMEMKRR